METRKRARPGKAKFVVFALLSGVLAGFWMLSAQMRPALAALASAQAKTLVSQALAQSILLQTEAENNSYSELINVGVANGQVYLLQANTQRMNRLASNTVQEAAQRITQLGETGVRIPLGTLSGAAVLAGQGPDLVARFQPVGGISSRFHSEFSSAGVNQTLHRIELVLSVTVEIALPGGVCAVKTETQMPIAESVIVGQVPAAFTDVASQEDMLNLIPTEAE